jgi:peroxiredoxin
LLPDPNGDKFLFDNQGAPFQISLMVAVNSTMLPLGTRAPDFRLPDTKGKMVSVADFENANALLVIFICNHCPYVKHIRSGLAQLARDYMPRGVAVVGISSNDVENYPQDSPRKMAEEAKAAGYIFPYLYDETQEVAKAYRAACTPDLYLFDGEQRLVYRGQLDDSRPGSNVPVTGKDVRAALDAVLAGKPVPPNQKASIGCNIKWKPGNEPEYFR